MKAKDLAKKLGVSPATISLVLNNKPGISDSLRHSLLEKIRELGCENMLSSSTAPPRDNQDSSPQSRPVIVYLIYTNFDEDNDRFAFYPAVLEGAEMEARDSHYNLVVLHMSYQGNRNLKRLVEDTGNAVGAIVQTYHITDAMLADLESLGIPCVFVDTYRPDRNVCSVCVNNEQGIFAAVEYLKNMGHQNLGYVYSGKSNDSLLERRRCFHQALREYGLADRRENYFTAGDAAEAEEFDILRELFRSAEHLPTALVAENDRLAWRAMKALQREGLKIPQDISIIGFDDRSICTMVEPNLTSVRNYRHLMGRECVAMLRNLQRNKKLGFHIPSLKLELPTALIPRDSVRDLTKE